MIKDGNFSPKSKKRLKNSKMVRHHLGHSSALRDDVPNGRRQLNSIGRRALEDHSKSLVDPQKVVTVRASQAQATVSLRKEMTFSFERIQELYLNNAQFRDAMDSDMYFYFDKHLVVKNKDAFVVTNGSLELDYEQEGFEERYCLAFKRNLNARYIRRKSLDTPYGAVVVSSSGLVIHASVYDETNGNTLEEFHTFLNDDLMIFSGGGGGGTYTFGKALIYFMDKKNCSVEKMIELTGISESTIKRYRADASKPTLSNVVAICVALRLEYYYSNGLINLAGYYLNRTLLHRAYAFILNTMSTFGSVDACNMFLRNNKLRPLTIK